jgi:hypothetical protein
MCPIMYLLLLYLELHSIVTNLHDISFAPSGNFTELGCILHPCANSLTMGIRTSIYLQ